MNKGGQMVFIGVIFLAMAFIIFILALPFINQAVSYGVSQSGTASGFFIKAIPFVMIIFLVIAGLRLIAGGGGE